MKLSLKHCYLICLTLSIIFIISACRSSGPENKTLSSRTKPSEQLQRENKRITRKAVRDAKRDLRKRRREKRKSGYYSDR
ncbi:MAG: hypothetical protein IT235_01910 [Bacteroidia bacterium]|nr:hypothetical protein [Bacteroidia bacterium]